jgi:CRISPR-associated exonuclease Cas4
LWLKSLRLGLYGRADVVEFKRTDGNDKRQAIKLAGAEGLWIPFPVEYKRGRLRTEKSFEIQLYAQALCLEEMLGIQVSTGALYYGKTRRRLEITLDKAVREKTEIAARRLHEIMDSGNTPDARRQPKCKHCSLNGLCLPKVVSHGSSASHYLKQVPTDPKVIA